MRTVTCVQRDRDRYGRVVAVCEGTGDDIGAWLVRHGWALDYASYSGGTYASQQSRAESERRGIWQGSSRRLGGGERARFAPRELPWICRGQEIAARVEQANKEARRWKAATVSPADARHLELELRRLARRIRSALRGGDPDRALYLANVYLSVVEARLGIGAVALPGRSGLFRVGG